MDAPDDQRRFSLKQWRNDVPDSLDAQMMRDAKAVFERGEKMQLTYTVRNTHRAVGTAPPIDGTCFLAPGWSGAACLVVHS